MHIKLMTGAAALALLLPIAAYAQSGAAAGAATGAIGGAVVGGPVGAVVGGVGGAVVGTITDANKPKFHEYVVREHHPSYHYDREVVVGATLPDTGVTYWEGAVDLSGNGTPGFSGGRGYMELTGYTGVPLSDALR